MVSKAQTGRGSGKANRKRLQLAHLADKLESCKATEFRTVSAILQAPGLCGMPLPLSLRLPIGSADPNGCPSQPVLVGQLFLTRAGQSGSVVNIRSNASL